MTAHGIRLTRSMMEETCRQHTHTHVNNTHTQQHGLVPAGTSVSDPGPSSWSQFLVLVSGLSHSRVRPGHANPGWDQSVLSEPGPGLASLLLGGALTRLSTTAGLSRTDFAQLR